MIDAPVTGYKRKISVYADVLLSGESTLIFATLCGGVRKLGSVSLGTSKASAGARCAKVCCSWKATSHALCDAGPFDRLSNVPIRQWIA